jgi:hypothetical protein
MTEMPSASSTQWAITITPSPTNWPPARLPEEPSSRSSVRSCVPGINRFRLLEIPSGRKTGLSTIDFALMLSRVRPFVLYSLRHTFLTRLGESGCDAWTLARIAGHSSIAMSARYVHPSEDAVLAALERLSGHNFRHSANTSADSLAMKPLASSSND